MQLSTTYSISLPVKDCISARLGSKHDFLLKAYKLLQQLEQDFVVFRLIINQIKDDIIFYFNQIRTKTSYKKQLLLGSVYRLNLFVIIIAGKLYFLS